MMTVNFQRMDRPLTDQSDDRFQTILLKIWKFGQNYYSSGVCDTATDTIGGYRCGLALTIIAHDTCIQSSIILFMLNNKFTLFYTQLRAIAVEPNCHRGRHVDGTRIVGHSCRVTKSPASDGRLLFTPS
jgi:hypothetical protein